jgi:hypothetical protein
MVVVAPDWGDVVPMSGASQGMEDTAAVEDAIGARVEKLIGDLSAIDKSFHFAAANRRGLAEGCTAGGYGFTN